MVSRRRLLMSRKSRLPNDYQELAYIESSGTQVIDTLVDVTTNMDVRLKFLLTNGFSDAQCIMLAGTSSPYQNYSFGESNYGSIRFGFGASRTTSSFVRINTDETYTVNAKIRPDGQEYNINNTSETIHGTMNSRYPSTTLPIFGRHDPTSYNHFCSMRLFNCTIAVDGAVVREFVPCYHKQSGETGLYDIINDAFYTNQGTGVFIRGGRI